MSAKYSTKVTRVCENCGNNFVVNQNLLKKSGTGRFCTMKCRRDFNTLDKRFWSYVRKIDDKNSCWEWTGATTDDGYGHIYVKGAGRTNRSNRISWELHFGEIPKDMMVCHRCDNPICVRPDHLFLGTGKDNMQDKIKKNRCNSVRGSSQPTSKLTEDQVIGIRRLSNEGVSQKELMSMYGVSQSNISAILLRSIWKHV